MIHLLWELSVKARYLLRRYMPSNIVLDLIRTRQELKWGVPAILLAVPYLAIAVWRTGLIDSGGPGWLHLIVLVCIRNALKMIVIGPVSVALLIRARVLENQARNRAESKAHDEVSRPELARISR